MKLYAYIVAAAILAGLAWYEIGVHKKAARVEVAEAALEREQKAHKATIAKAASDLKQSEEDRRALAKGLQSITDRFNKPLPPPKTLVQYVKVPGETCPRASLSDAFVVRYNAASDPTP